MNLKNKTVLITGAAKRVGRVIALEFAKKGAHVLIHYHGSRVEALRFEKELRQKGFSASCYQADFSKISEVETMGRLILKEHGRVDVLVNNASAFTNTLFGKTTEEQWDGLFAVNLKTPFFLSQLLAPAMSKPKAGGRIINIGDFLGVQFTREHLVHGLTKAGIMTMTKALAKELAPKILVTAICPGLILPPVGGLSKKQKKEWAKENLVGRWGCPEDVAKMAVFLAESDFMTGSVHAVDGGQLVR